MVITGPCWPLGAGCTCQEQFTGTTALRFSISHLFPRSPGQLVSDKNNKMSPKMTFGGSAVETALFGLCAWS